jgi:uncharacterized RDD family membrane protein YckC
LPYCSNCGSEEIPDQQFCSVCGKANSGSFAELAPMPYFAPNEPQFQGPPLAGYWWRVLGYLIDGLILVVVITLPLSGLNTNVYAASVIDVAIVFVYGTFFLTRMKGQTIGMKVARIRCVEAVNYARVTFSQAARRTAVYCVLYLFGTIYHYTKYVNPTAQQKISNDHHAAVALLFIVPLLLDLLWPIWDKRNQTLHDKIANTVVLRPPRD